MLKEFRFNNFKSFKDEAILSLEAMNKQEENLDMFNVVDFGKDKILKSVVIYGHNSYGKSNIFKALKSMLNIILKSANQDFKIEIDNFKLDIESKNKPSLFEITFKMDFIKNKNDYRYGFEIKGEKIIKEWLYRKTVREVNIFTRNSFENSSIEINSSYKELNKYKEFTRDNELFLSSMVRNNIGGEIKEIYVWIANDLKVASADELSITSTSGMFLNKEIDRMDIVKGLKNADLGIEDVSIIKNEVNYSEIPEHIIKFIEKNGKNKKIEILDTNEKIKHFIYNDSKECVGEEEFELEEKESEGTIKFYSILGPILYTLKKGKTLFLDELDSRLNHLLVKYIVGLFQSEVTNPNNAQLIFNGHDFYLLKENIFRRDQVYFVDKDKYGESKLYSLGDFKGIDKRSNVLGHYLAGNFGSLGKIKGE